MEKAKQVVTERYQILPAIYIPMYAFGTVIEIEEWGVLLRLIINH